LLQQNSIVWSVSEHGEDWKYYYVGM
jgi:hypothetical protein